MAKAQMDTVIRYLRRAVLRQDGAEWTDGQLLASFIDRKDEAAFEALVRRHGPMVFGVCRRVVPNHHDAEDAFQATFLVLASKAPSVRPRERLANWLHGVALRTAMKANTITAKRRGREKQVTEMPEPRNRSQESGASAQEWPDLQPLLDQELNGLPEIYRLPILLCDLEGKTIKEATQQLGWRQGTLAGRLARGRKLLAKRLANRGVVLSAGSLAAVVSQNAASASVPTSLVRGTVKAAAMIAAGQATVAGVVPAKVAILMEGVTHAMFMTKLKSFLAIPLALVATVGIGGGLLGYGTSSGQTENNRGDAVVGEKAEKQDKEAEKKQLAEELKKLQGTWSLVLQQWKGHDVNHGPGTLTLKGNACTVISERGMTSVTFTVQIAPPSVVSTTVTTTEMAKAMDFVVVGVTIRAIYKLEGDTLVLCQGPTNGERPSRFAAEVEGDNSLFIFRRVPPDSGSPEAIKQTLAPEQPKAEQRNKAVSDESTSQQVRPPKVADAQEYVIMSRLWEAGSDQHKEDRRLPKATVDEGQLASIHIIEGPQNLLEKVVLDEKIKIGTFLDLRVKRLGGSKVRLFLTFEKNELEKSSVSEINVLGHSVQAIRDVELHQPVNLVFQKDAKGSPQRWVEITVNEQNIPQAIAPSANWWFRFFGVNEQNIPQAIAPPAP